MAISTNKTVRTCNTCTSPFLKHTEKGVEIDVCNRCQKVWFDKGEFSRALTKTEQTALKKSFDALVPTDSSKKMCPLCNMIALVPYKNGIEHCVLCGGLGLPLNQQKTITLASVLMSQPKEASSSDYGFMTFQILLKMLDN